MKKVCKDTWYTTVPIYPAGVYLCTTAKAVTKLCAENEFEYDPGLAQGTCLPVWDEDDGAMYVLIYIGNHVESTLVHECVHAAWAVLDNVGVEVTADNHEALAYLVDWLYSECRPHAVFPDEE